MAKKREVCIFPRGAVCHKQCLPVLRLQCLPQDLGRTQQCGVFIEQGERIAQGSPLRSHTFLLYRLGLQAVELLLGAGETQPS